MRSDFNVHARAASLSITAVRDRKSAAPRQGGQR
jgi:hypothetical protein